MTFETELRDRMHTGIDDVDVDLGSLVTGSIAHGRKLRRLRRLTRIFAGAAAVAVLGGALAYGNALNSPAPPAGTQQTSAETKAATPQAALRILLETLPSTTPARDFDGWWEGVGTPDGLTAKLTYTDGGSTADVRVSLLNQRFAPAACIKSADKLCRLTTLPDGSRLQLIENQSAGSGGNYLHLQASLYRKDGLIITLLSENREEYNPDTSPTRPPLSLAQLKAIVLSPRWQRHLDAALVDGAGGLFTPRPISQPSGAK